MIALCRVFQRIQDWGPVAEAEVAEGARLARQAIETGKDDPDALWMAGYSMPSLAGDKATGESAVDRALLLNPNSAYAWMARGGLSYLQNRPGPAIEAYEHAIRLSPLDPLGYLFTCGLAFGHTIAGECEEALLWADRSLREMPRYRAAIKLEGDTLCPARSCGRGALMARSATGDRLRIDDRWIQGFLGTNSSSRSPGPLSGGIAQGGLAGSAGWGAPRA